MLEVVASVVDVVGASVLEVGASVLEVGASVVDVAASAEVAVESSVSAPVTGAEGFPSASVASSARGATVVAVADSVARVPGPQKAPGDQGEAAGENGTDENAGAVTATVVAVARIDLDRLGCRDLVVVGGLGCGLGHAPAVFARVERGAVALERDAALVEVVELVGLGG